MRSGAALLALTVALAVTALGLFGAASKGVSADSVGPTAMAGEPTVPGAGTAYLGAFVDPTGTALSAADPTGGTGSLQAELSALPGFDEQEGHSPAILSTFQDWAQPVDVAGLDSVAATGAVPMVTWDCGDTDANVVAGLDDAVVSAEAKGLAATDIPVLLRWFPDPNQPGQAAAAACLGATGAPGYIAAFQHIHNLFEAAGATNVAFVWSVDASAGGGPGAAYYPGGSVVDWIAADGGTRPRDESQPTAFAGEFGSWYSAFSPAGKPMMVSSTGADSGSQPAYLGQISSDLPSQFPQVKALVYFDAPESSSADQYQLDPAGAASFRQLAAAPAFTPNRSLSTTTISTPQSSVPVGTTLTLHASVNASDNSGSVSFVDNGEAIKGCVFIPITAPASCQTAAAGAGAQSFVALYGGDAAFSPSTSVPLTVTVTPPSAPKLSGQSSGGATTSTPTTTSSGPSASVTNDGTSPDASGVPAPATGSAYLGSFVDPSGSSLRVKNPTGGIASLSSELAALPAVQETLGRPLSIVPVFLDWGDSLTVTELDRVVATGGTPMITWNCGDTDANVTAGLDDGEISQVATTLARFGLPVFLRWFPDPNVNTAASKACLGGGGAAGYVAAYHYIYDKLATTGVANVTSVWSVDTTTPHGDPSWGSYYPGPADVDWIGADGYASSSLTATVASDFGAWYAEFSADKPLMISQTAAIPSLQAQYIDQLSTVPSQYPQIRAVIYFDAPDVASARSYELQPQSVGAQRFAALSDLPSFQPARAPTTTVVTSSESTLVQGQTAHLTAQVAAPDPGGDLTFLDNGSVIPGCAGVALDVAGSCDTSTLSLGGNQIVVDYSGDAAASGSVSQPLDLAVTANPPPVGPPAVPGPGGVYLGAWVRPEVTHSVLPLPAAVQEELTGLPSFNAGLARSLSIVHIYQTWKNPAPTRQVEQVVADGSIPMIDWACGDTDANIIAGTDDALITAEAQELAAVKAPVFLRWYYEPNFPGSADYANCIGGLGPAGYAAAFRHIHDLFTAAGASNVAFVFAIATAGADQDLYQYYPGSAYVDWIAADGYARTADPPPTAFVDRFSSWYSDFATFGKPLMVSETAAFAGGQASYLQQVEDAVSQSGTFPLIKAVLYFDAPGNDGNNTYPLNGAGWQSFQSLSANAMFQPARLTSAVAATVSPVSTVAGNRVRLNAEVSNSDFGGSVSFEVNGAPLAECQSIPLATVTSCSTTLLPVGTNQISAVYSGDAEVQGSAATTVSRISFGPSATTPSGSGSTAGAAPVPGSPLPQFAFLTFLGLPDFGGVPSTGGARSDGALFAFPLTLSLPDFATSNHGSGSNLDPIEWTKSLLRGGAGATAVLVPVGGAILLLLVTYMVSTWTQDRRRARQVVPALAGNAPPDRETGPSKPEEPVHQP
jgi:beta-mannanase